ncbi:MAG: hypothetical protein H6657_01890 [Ardenticatenaceae bacterium]|nr:hypothetical protein [Ardenticatenaceae bacterium]
MAVWKSASGCTEDIRANGGETMRVAKLYAAGRCHATACGRQKVIGGYTFSSFMLAVVTIVVTLALAGVLSTKTNRHRHAVLLVAYVRPHESPIKYIGGN